MMFFRDLFRQLSYVAPFVLLFSLFLYNWWAVGPAIVAWLLIRDGWNKAWAGWRHE
jgi:hypothetical protein